MHVHFRNPYSESIKEMLATFGTATYKVGLKVHPNEEDPRVPIMCWKCSQRFSLNAGSYRPRLQTRAASLH